MLDTDFSINISFFSLLFTRFFYFIKSINSIAELEWKKNKSLGEHWKVYERGEICEYLMEYFVEYEFIR
jgi:restriction endonuclease S subunit